jgi:predicted nucleic acid-binding protein
MILIDTNIIMYAAGAEHPHKQPSAQLLQQVAAGDVDAIIDAETLQEILHRYRSIKRWADGRRVYDLARQIFPEIIPLTSEVLDNARRLLDANSRLMARDALHAAIVIGEGLDAICTYDRDFDGIPGVRRIEPLMGG